MTKRFVYLVFCGFFLGLSLFAPGFSGSVVAIIMGVYHDLVKIASNPIRQMRKNANFVLPLGIGAVISAVLFVLFFNFLFQTYEKATYLLFVGLILGNLPVLYTEAKKSGFKKSYLLGGVASFAAALILGIMSANAAGQAESAAAVVPALHVMVIGGVVTGFAVPIPGMSTAVVLILMNMYTQLIYVADALLRFDTTYLLHFGLFFVSSIAGVVIISKGIKTVFERFAGPTNSVALGFISGSMIGILVKTFGLSDTNFTWLFGGIMIAVGLVVSLIFGVVGKNMGGLDLNSKNKE